jgi:hypothetical protein
MMRIQDFCMWVALAFAMGYAAARLVVVSTDGEFCSVQVTADPDAAIQWTSLVLPLDPPRRIRIERSRDLLHWEPYLVVEMPAGLTLSMIEPEAFSAFYRITHLNP